MSLANTSRVAIPNTMATLQIQLNVTGLAVHQGETEQSLFSVHCV